jgi:V8-like Glu-specific endopeptidase
MPPTPPALPPLTGEQYQAFVDGLVAAFPNSIDLAMMLQFRLTKSLNAIVAPGPTSHQAFSLIQTSEAEGWTFALLEAARKSRPGSAALLAAAQLIGTPTNVPAGPQLEKVINKLNKFHDITRWREAMAAIETRVCRISVSTNKGKIFGTGFLVGPDVVMTNHHVIDAVIAGEKNEQNANGRSAKATDVVCQFDYKKVAGYLNQGIEVKLATKWLIDSSPASAVDLMPEPKPGLPGVEELDYALLRLERKLGDQPITGTGENAELQADKRGWIKVPAGKQTFDAQTPIFIVQHPDAAPLAFAMDTTGVLGPNGNGTRVKYTTNTLGGSSGSPCFNQDWELVALHHSGDPNFDPITKPAYNEGIPMHAIRRLLAQRQLESILGS